MNTQSGPEYRNRVPLSFACPLSGSIVSRFTGLPLRTRAAICGGFVVAAVSNVEPLDSCSFNGRVLPCLKAWLGSGTGDPTGARAASGALKPVAATGAPKTPNGDSDVTDPQMI